MKLLHGLILSLMLTGCMDTTNDDYPTDTPFDMAVQEWMEASVNYTACIEADADHLIMTNSEKVDLSISCRDSEGWEGACFYDYLGC